MTQLADFSFVLVQLRPVADKVAFSEQLFAREFTLSSRGVEVNTTQNLKY
jgi:hypothetical protein